MFYESPIYGRCKNFVYLCVAKTVISLDLSTLYLINIFSKNNCVNIRAQNEPRQAIMQLK